MRQTETGKVEMAPGIAAYATRNGHLMTLRWVRDNGEQVARHGKIVGWTADAATGEQWLRFRPTGRDTAIRIPARMLQRQLEAERAERVLAEATPADRCEECGKVLGSGRIGFLDESVVPGLCFNCA